MENHHVNDQFEGFNKKVVNKEVFPQLVNGEKKRLDYIANRLL